MINKIIDLAIDCGLMVTAVDIIDVKVKKFNVDCRDILDEKVEENRSYNVLTENDDYRAYCLFKKEVKDLLSEEVYVNGKL